MSIRMRLAIAFALAAAALFSLGGWLFASALSATQLQTIDSQLSTLLVQAGRYFPAGATVPRPPGGPLADEFVIEIIDPAGRVRAASRDAGSPRLVTTSQLSRARQGPIFVTRAVDADNTRIAAAPFGARHPGWVTVAAQSLETYEATQRQVARELSVGGAVFAAVAGLGAYWLAQAALSPVERLRRQVAAISEHGGTSNVQVPATRDEVAALAGTMNDLLGRLQRALAWQRAFVADASHELRTPLAVLHGELELAARPGRGLTELTAAVQRARAEADRLVRLTNDLLLLARSDEDRLSLQPEPTDVAALLRTSVASAATRLSAAGLTGQVDAWPGLAQLDPVRVRQAIDNLVDNALCFAPAGSMIVLTARLHGSDLDLEISDEGPGFPDGFLPRAFERFARPDGIRSRDDGGAGLGLAIVQAVAIAHGGVATAANKPDGGAVVRLHLPGAALSQPDM